MPVASHARRRDRDAYAYPRGFYCEDHEWLSETSAEVLQRRLDGYRAELAALDTLGRRAKGRRRTLRKQMGWARGRQRDVRRDCARIT